MYELEKLKLDKFNTYNGFNIPENLAIPLELHEHPEVYFLFCSNFEDLNRHINIVLNNQTHKENRLFIIYKKGQKHFHRDHIMMYVRKSPFLIQKAPMLCSLNKEYSCITTMIKK